jgi:hypothetical protein
MSSHNDLKLVKWLGLLLLLPLTLAIFSGDRFRYPCQDPANWDKDMCKMPICDVRRECPEHIFKGQRDPRLGPPKDEPTKTPTQSFAPAPACAAQPTQGANCGK